MGVDKHRVNAKRARTKLKNNDAAKKSIYKNKPPKAKQTQLLNGDLAVVEGNEIVAVQKRKPGAKRNKQLPKKVKPKSEYDFNPDTAIKIVKMVSGGMTFSEIGKLEGFPNYNIIQKWEARRPEFKLELNLARKLRAEVFHDKALNTAEKSDHKTVQSDRLRVDTYKWASQVNDPERFSPSMKVKGDPDAPLKIVVETGIRRDEDAIEVNAIDDEESFDRLYSETSSGTDSQES